MDNRLMFCTGYSAPDRRVPTEFPLTVDNCRALMTPEIDRLLGEYSEFIWRAEGCEPHDFELALEIQEAAELLADHAYAMLCRSYIEACHQPEGETGMQTRRLLGI